jgi:uncharacterized protein (TIGR02646 family)
MKRVSRLAAAPPLLQAWLGGNPAAVTAPGEQAKAIWEQFKSDPAYRQLLDELVKLQRGLCCYCEQRVTKADGTLVTNDYQVEHVFPKSGGPGRVVDATNLVLACGGGTWAHHTHESRFAKPIDANMSCGQKKDNLDLGTGCDPRTFPTWARLTTVDTLGVISADVAACNAAGVDPIVLNETMNRVLNLNSERLKRFRAKLVGELLSWLNPILKELLTDDHATAGDHAAGLALLAQSRLRPDGAGHLRAFWSVWRQYLEPASEDWVAANHVRL